MDQTLLAADQDEIVQIQGVKIALDPGVMSAPVLTSLRTGRYEKGEARYLPDIIEPGERLVELGGGLGFLSALAWREGKTEAVVVIEANPDLIPLIRSTHRLNGVEAVVRNAAAVGRRVAETVAFYRHRHFWSSSMTPIPESRRIGVSQIPVVTLDEMVTEHRPTMLIVDVEGTEVELLAESNLDGVRKLMIELHHERIGFPGVKAVFDGLSARGFHYDPRFSHEAVVLFRRL